MKELEVLLSKRWILKSRDKEMYYKLFINNGSNYPTYWMSSRCVNAYSSGADFSVRSVLWTRQCRLLVQF